MSYILKTSVSEDNSGRQCTIQEQFNRDCKLKLSAIQCSELSGLQLHCNMTSTPCVALKYDCMMLTWFIVMSIYIVKSITL